MHPLVLHGHGWCELRRPARGTVLRPCLFLDRDGCIVVEVHHLHRVEDTALIPGAAETIAAANAAGWYVVEVTNQSGIARGLFGWDEFAAVQDRIHTELAEAGAAIDLVLASPWHTDGTGPWQGEHDWRKPGPGMLQQAARVLPIDLARSWIVGDHATDIAAGRAAGIAAGLHVATGHGARHRAEALALATDRYRVRGIDSLADVAAIAPWKQAA